ncbi:MAG: 2-C-methyl-D-erythritol 4-phosphate cytidylyltransferase [Alistipes sp.]
MENIGVILVAGGSGNRMGAARPKQFMLLDGQPILTRTINTFAKALPMATVVVVLPEEHRIFWQNLSARFETARHTVVAGGVERFHSVRNGLAALSPDVELIAVHDGCRPLTSVELIHRTLEAAKLHHAAIPVVEVTDSFRQIEGEKSHAVDRHSLRAVQTPQIFRAALLRKAYETEFSPLFTDDASVVEQTGEGIFLCEGERSNLKITTPDDLLIAQALLAAECEQRELHDEPTNEPIPHAPSSECVCGGGYR